MSNVKPDSQEYWLGILPIGRYRAKRIYYAYHDDMFYSDAERMEIAYATTGRFEAIQDYSAEALVRLDIYQTYIELQLITSRAELFIIPLSQVRGVWIHAKQYNKTGKQG